MTVLVLMVLSFVSGYLIGHFRGFCEGISVLEKAESERVQTQTQGV